MITLPAYHVPTKYEGYVYNVQDNILYSFKNCNELRPLKKRYPNRFNRIHIPGFDISENGKRRFVPISYLRSLTLFDTIKNPTVKKRGRKRK